MHGTTNIKILSKVVNIFTYNLRSLGCNVHNPIMLELSFKYITPISGVSADGTLITSDVFILDLFCGCHY